MNVRTSLRYDRDQDRDRVYRLPIRLYVKTNRNYYLFDDVSKKILRSEIKYTRIDGVQENHSKYPTTCHIFKRYGITTISKFSTRSVDESIVTSNHQPTLVNIHLQRFTEIIFLQDINFRYNFYEMKAFFIDQTKLIELRSSVRLSVNLLSL